MDPIDRILERAREAAAAVRQPESTYRLQFHAGFTFRDAACVAPYLRDLGVTHCYASPYLKARPGSTHGYDIVDHNVLNPEIGTEADYDAFVAALKECGLGQILDVVPNHMGVGTNENAWWNDVLENGPASRFAGHFDIQWRASPRPQLQDKVLLPVLGEPYGDVLEAGQLRLAFENGVFVIHYHDRGFPVAPRSYARILGHNAERLADELGAEDPARLEYESIVTAARNLPDRSETDPARVAERAREKEVIKRRLGALSTVSEHVRAFIERNVAQFNGTPGDPRSFDLLDELLEHQCYRLSYWRVAPDEINYRRFFDINDLAALSMERLEVFEAVHGLVLRLVADGKIDGLRIDHPDGLYEPAGYFRRLQQHFLLARARRLVEDEFRDLDWGQVEARLRERLADSDEKLLYVVAEKILGAGEPLVELWAVHGTSGYDFLNAVNGLFVDSRHANAFTRLYRDLVEDAPHFAEVAYQKKRLILNASLASELHMLTYQLDQLAQKSRKSRDFTFATLRAALREVIACFPVYRSYITDRLDDADRRHVEVAARRAAARNPLISRRVFQFIRDTTLLQTPEPFTDEDRAEQRRFVGKFQQVTAPVTAKGVEDTAFYVYNRLVSLNEVGGEPGRFGSDPGSLHRYNRERQQKWPRALSPLSTHDTKRGEDVRARINVLSEMPDEWRAAVGRWRELNAPHRAQVEHRDVPEAPDANDEYLLYQTLVGAWPLESCTPQVHEAFVGRIQAYVEKALREAKVYTSWINPDEVYEQAMRAFVARILDPQSAGAFLADFRAFQKRVSHYGLFNSLSQTLLKLTAPGVPDTYQGTELWDFSLVDPDNRRPVDYARRAAMLREVQEAAASAGDGLRDFARSLVESKEDGRVKLFVTYRALHCRREYPGLFSEGEYVPLSATGQKAEHLFAFARRSGDARAIVAVPRLVAGLAPGEGRLALGAEVWGDSRLELEGIESGVEWVNGFTGERHSPAASEGSAALRAAELFAHFPVALLLAFRQT